MWGKVCEEADFPRGKSKAFLGKPNGRAVRLGRKSLGKVGRDGRWKRQ